MKQQSENRPPALNPGLIAPWSSVLYIYSPDSPAESNFCKKGSLYAGSRHVSSLVFRLSPCLWDSWSMVCESGNWYGNRRSVCIHFGELSVSFLNRCIPNFLLWSNSGSNFSYPEKRHVLISLQARRNEIKERHRSNIHKLLPKVFLCQERLCILYICIERTL